MAPRIESRAPRASFPCPTERYRQTECAASGVPMGGLEAIFAKLRIHYLEGCVALCEVAAASCARKLKSESLSDQERDEIKNDMDAALRDRDTLQLMADLIRRKRREEAGLPPFPDKRA